VSGCHRSYRTGRVRCDVRAVERAARFLPAIHRLGVKKLEGSAVLSDRARGVRGVRQAMRWRRCGDTASQQRTIETVC